MLGKDKAEALTHHDTSTLLQTAKGLVHPNVLAQAAKWRDDALIIARNPLLPLSWLRHASSVGSPASVFPGGREGKEGGMDTPRLLPIALATPRTNFLGPPGLVRARARSRERMFDEQR